MFEDQGSKSFGVLDPFWASELIKFNHRRAWSPGQLRVHGAGRGENAPRVDDVVLLLHCPSSGLRMRASRLTGSTSDFLQLYCRPYCAPAGAVGRVLSNLLYGPHTASLKIAELCNLDAFQVRCLRKILRVPHLNVSHATNAAVLEQTRSSVASCYKDSVSTLPD